MTPSPFQGEGRGEVAPRPEDDPELFRAVQGDLPEFLRLKKLEKTYAYGVREIRGGRHVYHKNARGVWYSDPAREEARRWERAGEALGDFLRWSRDHQWDAQGFGPWPGPGSW